MGNKVSAEANNINIHGSSGSPPPECPMHKKEANPKNAAPSECPVQHDNDINPYNMVI